MVLRSGNKYLNPKLLQIVKEIKNNAKENTKNNENIENLSSPSKQDITNQTTGKNIVDRDNPEDANINYSTTKSIFYFTNSNRPTVLDHFTIKKEEKYRL